MHPAPVIQDLKNPRKRPSFQRTRPYNKSDPYVTDILKKQPKVSVRRNDITQNPHYCLLLRGSVCDDPKRYITLHYITLH